MGSLFQGSVKIQGNSKPPFKYAEEHGFTGTEEDFYKSLAIIDDFAILGDGGKIAQDQLPELDYAASQHTHGASDVGADAVGTAENKVNTHNTDTNAHADIRALIDSKIAARIEAVLSTAY
jgi:hypothetical protein